MSYLFFPDYMVFSWFMSTRHLDCRVHSVNYTSTLTHDIHTYSSIPFPDSTADTHAETDTDYWWFFPLLLAFALCSTTYEEGTVF